MSAEREGRERETEREAKRWMGKENSTEDSSIYRKRAMTTTGQDTQHPSSDECECTGTGTGQAKQRPSSISSRADHDGGPPGGPALGRPAVCGPREPKLFWHFDCVEMKNLDSTRLDLSRYMHSYSSC